MANTTWYGDGTATVAAGSRTVTGTNTGWLTEVAGLTPIKAGDKFGIHVGRPIVIEQIISDTELLLADDWPGPAQTDAPYKVELTSPTIAAVEAMRRLLASLSNGNLDSLAEITIGTDDIPIGIGPGVFGTVNKFTLKDGVQFDVAVPNMAGRAAYNGAAAGFRVLVADIGDGRSALYIKNSATSGDWSVPYYITGPVGPAGVRQRGNYSAGTAYSALDLVQYGGSTWIAKIATTGNAPPTLPTTENTQWLLFARSGTAGVVDRGAYSAVTAYAANDIVLDNGSTWIALQSTTGNAPPVLPTESNAFWRLLARKGTDGTGTGDVVGPAGGVVEKQIAGFGSTSGKTLVGLTAAEARAAIGASVLTGFHNKIINGGFAINQRVTYPVVIAPGENKYVSDRFRLYNATNQTLTVVRGATPLGFPLLPPHANHFLSVSCPAVATGSFFLTQNVEDVRTLSGGRATQMLYAASDNTGSSLRLYLEQRFGSGGSATVPIIMKDYSAILGGGGDGWRKFAGSAGLPSVEGKVEGNNSFLAFVAEFLPRATGNIYLACASLVEGDASADEGPFSPRHPQQELALCQRYFEKVNFDYSIVATAASQLVTAMSYFKTTKRSTPSIGTRTVTLANNGTFNSYQSLNGEGVGVYYASNAAGVVRIVGTVEVDAEL